MNPVKIEKAYFLLFFIAIILATYVYFLKFLDSNYRPFYGDAYFYFKNSEKFYLTGSLSAAFTYSGFGALLLKADAHGPAYPLIYGIISKVLTWNNLLIPAVNLATILTATLALWYSQTIAKEKKIMQILLIFGSPITLFYLITYLPELIHIACGVGLFLFFQNYLKNNTRQNLIIIMIYIIIIGMIRSTWFFAFFGIISISSNLKTWQNSTLLVTAFILPFIFQLLFHEQVPNTFSNLDGFIKSKEYSGVFYSIFYNIKRNIYFAFTYSEGYFYTIQKLWILSTLIAALIFYKKEAIIKAGLVMLSITILFNIILYKNYSWVDLRMYTSLTIFLNLGIISSMQKSWWPTLLVGMNLTSFLLILPLQCKIIQTRLNPDIKKFPKNVLNELRQLDSPLILIDNKLLDEYALEELPIIGLDGNPIQYELPYYELEMKQPTHIVFEENDQLKVRSINILAQ